MEIRLEDYQYYIRPWYTDMRKGPTSLAYLVQYEMGLEPFGKSVFLFCGRSRRTVKAIVWDRNGWLCLSKRLDCGMPFIWPRTGEDARRVRLDQVLSMLRDNALWITDAMVLSEPRVIIETGGSAQRRRGRCFAFLDDKSRMVTNARFYADESAESLLDCM